MDSVYMGTPADGEDTMSVRIPLGIVAVVMVVLAVHAVSFAQSSAGAVQASRSAQAPVAGNPAEQDPIAAMKADLQKMNALLAQMRNNAGFAANVTSPLYHQFELENEMWQLQLEQLQRDVEALERVSKPAK